MRVHAFWFNTELHVWRESTVADGAGGETVTYVDQGAESFKVDAANPQERLTAAQAGANHTNTIYAEVGTDIRRNDRLAASGIDPNDDRPYYEIIATEGLEPSEPIYVKAHCERLESGP